MKNYLTLLFICNFLDFQIDLLKIIIVIIIKLYNCRRLTIFVTGPEQWDPNSYPEKTIHLFLNDLRSLPMLLQWLLTGGRAIKTICFFSETTHLLGLLSGLFTSGFLPVMATKSLSISSFGRAIETLCFFFETTHLLGLFSGFFTTIKRSYSLALAPSVSLRWYSHPLSPPKHH